ncbi:DUF3093 domain-containing protein [Microbacterium sp. zg.Y1090]|uniref:DUF3093 domain-containing protein n=1 Tax=Microbacterium TaxID=33882 RepID=UPI00214AB189|nr:MULTISPECIES: DUF3093 domain-containing protein [unclassified Microbacterium]MCR2811845.1 DUF3093 domain-containing protein [Microbacterium sp. zg.Y1084]MCR2818716.1 DUF3093 domain-containing protein [Microbacterium sp. zg.Y1090]MDL5486529.1 DUF3093 domain-containing protein [Microbacterium sp. zg-Y1211]WIM27037.1 DUF3093 domain-containing protein [Microbacterium sp. zg-Y1090]
MQKTAAGTRPAYAYRERLTPSLWALVSAAVVGPMAALVLTAFNPTVGLIVGGILAVAVVALMLALSPVIEVRDGWLYAGKAKIELQFLGDPDVFVGEDARRARGPELDPRSWMLVRPGIDGLVRVPVDDPRDPVPCWVLSSRTPDRLSAIIRAARPGV